jgi:hypothetical protein
MSLTKIKGPLPLARIFKLTRSVDELEDSHLSCRRHARIRQTLAARTLRGRVQPPSGRSGSDLPGANS